MKLFTSRLGFGERLTRDVRIFALPLYIVRVGVDALFQFPSTFAKFEWDLLKEIPSTLAFLVVFAILEHWYVRARNSNR